MGGTIGFAFGSVVVGVAGLGLKFLAYELTGSVALYSDALESMVNVATALAALVAVRVAHTPPDAEHPYGHHKAEFFSAVVEGAMIAVAAVLIMIEAYHGVLAPRALDAPGIGLAVNGVAGVLNAGWSLVLMRQGRRRRSPALVADGKHLMSDVVTSVGVLIGVGLVALTGWAILDPLLAGLVALGLLRAGWQVMTESLSGLLDEAAPAETRRQIEAVIAETGIGALQAHAIRTRHAGPVTFIDFHLVVPGETTVSAAHAICDRIEGALEAALGGAIVTIHVEPEDSAEHGGTAVPASDGPA
jgi:cation diffusion facilitator family transporter